MNSSNEYELIDEADLTERICNIPGLEGVTLSGGEPFQQDPKCLLKFLRSLKENADLGVMVYTGYQLSELRDDGRFNELFDYIDLVVDGPYVYDLDGGELWRGSSNQKFHFLTGRYASLVNGLEAKKGRPIDITFEKGLQFSFAGIPPKDFRKRLAHRLHGRGMDIEW